MERSFECPICLERYTSSIKPLMIPCGHTACSGCISTLQKEKALECPVCRTLHHNVNILNLSVNYALISSENTSGPKLSLWDKIEEIHKQVNQLNTSLTQLSDNHEKSKSSLSNLRTMVQNKYEMITAITQNTFKSLITHIEEIERENSNKREKQEANLRNLFNQRSEMLEQMQNAYNNNQELSGNIKLQLLSLKIPDFDLGFGTYLLQNHDDSMITEKIKGFFGVIDKVQEMEIDKKPEEKKIIEKSEVFGKASQVIENKNEEVKNFEKGKGRGVRNLKPGEHREDGVKQPRQAKSEGPGWYVENRFGKWEKLQGWYEDQIKAGMEKGEQNFNIFYNGKLVYYVMLGDLRSYRISKGKPGFKFNRIKYEAE